MSWTPAQTPQYVLPIVLQSLAVIQQNLSSALTLVAGSPQSPWVPSSGYPLPNDWAVTRRLPQGVPAIIATPGRLKLDREGAQQLVRWVAEIQISVLYGDTNPDHRALGCFDYLKAIDWLLNTEGLGIAKGDSQSMMYKSLPLTALWVANGYVTTPPTFGTIMKMYTTDHDYPAAIKVGPSMLSQAGLILTVVLTED